MGIQTTSHTSKSSERFSLIAFTLFCFFAFTYNLSEVPPYHADENFYVNSARAMINSNDYITPTYHGEKRFAKPILFYWLVTASYKIFGINLFAARIVSAFFGAMCIPVVYVIARRMFDHKTAIISTLLLPGCYLHFQISRWAITDMALNFFIIMTFYFFIHGLKSEPNKRILFYLAYFSMAIGFMIKGPPALIIPTIVIGSFVLILRDWKALPRLQVGSGVTIVLAIILPWFVTMFFIHGNEFKNHILGAEIRDRIIHDTPLSFYYLGVTLRYYLPWSFFFLTSIVVRFGLTSINTKEVSVKRNYLFSLISSFKSNCSELTKREHQPFLFCLLWIAAPLLLFTLFRIEHSRYMLPISPPIAMITGYFLSQINSSKQGLQHNTFKIPFYLTVLFYLLIAFLITIALLVLNPVFPAPPSLMGLPIFILFGLGLLFGFYKSRKSFSLILTLAIIQIATLSLLSGNALSFFNRYPMKSFAKQILADPRANIRVGLYQLGNHRARMGVITGLPSINLSNPEELKQFIQSGQNIYMVMRQSDWDNKFRNTGMTVLATDSAWKKSPKNKIKIDLILKKGIKPYLSDYSESYFLLKTENKK